MSLFHQFPHGFRFRIISVAKDMVLPFFIPTGKLYAREKLRVFRFPQLLDLFPEPGKVNTEAMIPPEEAWPGGKEE